jgi:hypothetical protein
MERWRTDAGSFSRQRVLFSQKATTLPLVSWPLSWWGYQDLNLGPLPYQVSSAAWLTCVQPGRVACRVVREWPLCLSRDRPIGHAAGTSLFVPN